MPRAAQETYQFSKARPPPMMTFPVTKTKIQPTKALRGRFMYGMSRRTPMTTPPTICAAQYSDELSERARRVKARPGPE